MSLTLGQRIPKETTNECLNVSFLLPSKGLFMLDIWVTWFSNPYFLSLFTVQITDDAFNSPYWETAPKGFLRKNQSPRAWAKTWNVKKVIELLHPWINLSALNNTRMMLKTVMILALAMPKRLTGSARNKTKCHAGTFGLHYFPASVWATEHPT